MTCVVRVLLKPFPYIYIYIYIEKDWANAEKSFLGEISVFTLPTLPIPPKLLSQFYSNSRAGSQKGTGCWWPGGGSGCEVPQEQISLHSL